MQTTHVIPLPSSVPEDLFSLCKNAKGHEDKIAALAALSTTVAAQGRVEGEGEKMNTCCLCCV
jgi:hypothetical protein